MCESKSLVHLSLRRCGMRIFRSSTVSNEDSGVYTQQQQSNALYGVCALGKPLRLREDCSEDCDMSIDDAVEALCASKSIRNLLLGTHRSVLMWCNSVASQVLLKLRG
ncbi:hypothetical protein TRVL_08933 [Trypanosoma vivax]|nr:hypothetical protein TRVL_08933 [Trypanosoma vivax]